MLGLTLDYYTVTLGPISINWFQFGL